MLYKLLKMKHTVVMQNMYYRTLKAFEESKGY